ncbi:hypothetical protein [Pedobacter sp. MC2016-24]|uniref:hypothetical protein n=1 Tax=Pedobacter sp. MC2016-24 TaxID=2780090 RepID=UPI00188305F4|nr:hypothetical protein [Pedobacter sp. MC2016-24]MBE9601905.1 hypothetical protein [Pedobacter sp. MC2016-24]
MKTEIANKLSLLIDSLKQLSSSYQEQIFGLPEFVDVFDEVISDFDDAFRWLPDLMDEKIISYEVVKQILKCNNLIELNLTIEEYKTDKSFELDDTWNLVREYAASALKLLKIDQNDF